MPFHGFADFEDCVRTMAQRDGVADPHALCGKLQAEAGVKVALTIEKVRELCPPCAEKMERFGLSTIFTEDLTVLLKDLRKAVTASVDGEDHPASDFAYVPDPDMPSTWKLPIFDAAHARNALARLNQTEIPSGDKEKVRAKVERAAREFGVDVGGEAASKAFTIVKADDAKQEVFGWSSVAITKDGMALEDLQEDIIDPEDLEDAAYEFMLYSRGVDEMHNGRVKGQIIESFLVTPEKLEKMGLTSNGAPQVGWWIGAKLDRESYVKVKSGTYSMFSIEGGANRVEV